MYGLWIFFQKITRWLLFSMLISTVPLFQILILEKVFIIFLSIQQHPCACPSATRPTVCFWWRARSLPGSKTYRRAWRGRGWIWGSWGASTSALIIGSLKSASMGSWSRGRILWVPSFGCFKSFTPIRVWAGTKNSHSVGFLRQE